MTYNLCIFVKLHLQMILYTIKLTKTEEEELHQIINKGFHTSQTFRVAYILLNCDEGKYSDKVNNEQISKVLKVGMQNKYL